METKQIEMNERDYYTFMRLKKKIKQSEVAKAVNVNQSFISRHEQGECTLKQYDFEIYKRFIDDYKQ